MKERLLIIIVMATMQTFCADPAQAGFKYAVAQPLAPGVIGISWRAAQRGTAVRLFRLDQPGETLLADLATGKESYVDAGQFPHGALVRYRLVELAAGKEIAAETLCAWNSSELVVGGDFETCRVGDQKLEFLDVAVPAPLSWEIVAGGVKPGRQCLKVNVPDGQARYSFGKAYFYVRPPTRYTFSFRTTNPSPVLSRGLINVFTEKLEQSRYAKVTHYLFSPAQEKEGWIRLALTHELFADERLLSYEMIWDPTDNSGSVCFDNMSLIDEDLQYLETHDAGKLIETARAGLRKHPKLAPPELPKILEEIENSQKKMAAPKDLAIDDFLKLRAEVVADLHRLGSINTVFQIADLK